MKNFHKKNNSGVALLIVLISLALIAIFLAQLSYTSNIDLMITKKNQKRLQAYYLAHSAARLGLLRVQIYKELENLIQSQNSISSLIPANIRPMVWSFPLPEFPLPVVDESKRSEAPGKFIAIIKGEGSKIPINLLDGEFARMPASVWDKEEAKKVQEAVQKQIQGLLEIRAENDDQFRAKFDGNYRSAYVDSLRDWLDTDNNLVQGGDESNIYDRKTPSYRQRNDRIPSLSEISMVDLWDDDVFRFLKNEFSTINLYPQVNCNTLSLDRIKLYSKNQLTSESLALIQKRRTEEPFSSITECETFIKTNPDIIGGSEFNIPPEVNYNKGKDSNRETVFTIDGSANVGDARAVVRLFVRIDEDAPKENTTPPKTGDPPKKEELSKFQEVRVIRFEEGAPQ
jgi:hypothetical protein